MAKLSEILNIESNRAESLNIVHLVKEGGFYRAYEWSAWLIVNYCYTDEVRNATQDRKPLTVSHKPIKNSDTTFTFVGFPIKSIDKFLPNQISFTPVTDSMIDIAVSLPVCTYDELKIQYEEWRASIPVTEDKKKPQKESSDSGSHPHTLTGIMSQVLSYPLESKTPIENMVFISELKKQLAEII